MALLGLAEYFTPTGESQAGEFIAPRSLFREDMWPRHVAAVVEFYEGNWTW